MRGIFWYAGVDPDSSANLFAQTAKTQRALEDANTTLNETIKRSWSQGKDLKFMLRHNSAKKAIDLLIQDPAVSSQYVSASHRSAGFTQFFTIKTILHARQREHQAGARDKADSLRIYVLTTPPAHTGNLEAQRPRSSARKSADCCFIEFIMFKRARSVPERRGPRQAFK